VKLFGSYWNFNTQKFLAFWCLHFKLCQGRLTAPFIGCGQGKWFTDIDIAICRWVHLQCVQHTPKCKAWAFYGGWGHASLENFWKMHALRLNLVFSKAQNCYAKDRLWKSAVREIIGSIYITPDTMHGSDIKWFRIFATPSFQWKSSWQLQVLT